MNRKRIVVILIVLCVLLLSACTANDDGVNPRGDGWSVSGALDTLDTWLVESWDDSYCGQNPDAGECQ